MINHNDMSGKINVAAVMANCSVGSINPVLACWSSTRLGRVSYQQELAG